MILECVVLNIKAGQESDFESNFKSAQEIIIGMQGYISHQLQKCIESHGRFLLLINWQTLEDHTKGFRESPEYQDWRTLLHKFYKPMPVVEHYEVVFSHCK